MSMEAKARELWSKLKSGWATAASSVEILEQALPDAHREGMDKGKIDNFNWSNGFEDGFKTGKVEGMEEAAKVADWWIDEARKGDLSGGYTAQRIGTDIREKIKS